MVIDEPEPIGHRPPAISGETLRALCAEICAARQSQKLNIVVDAGQGLKPEPVVLPQGTSKTLELLGSIDTRSLVERAALARKTFKDVRPQIRALFRRARLHHTLQIGIAYGVVETLMSAPLANSISLMPRVKLEDKDGGIAYHSLAVSALMIAFARNLGLNSETVRLLGLGGLLHDIGKMIIPVALLQKSGPLPVAELTAIRMHQELGREIIAQIAGVQTAVLDVCLYHHERFDGTGYPQRLVGRDIPYVARIASICDVYDALIAARPYKRAWSHPEAISSMLRSEGQFDPDLLDAFVSFVGVEREL